MMEVEKFVLAGMQSQAKMGTKPKKEELGY